MGHDHHRHDHRVQPPGSRAEQKHQPQHPHTERKGFHDPGSSKQRPSKTERSHDPDQSPHCTHRQPNGGIGRDDLIRRCQENSHPEQERESGG